MHDKKMQDFMMKRAQNQGNPSKEELKYKEREEIQKKEKDAVLAVKKQKEEQEQVRKEVIQYRQAID